MNFKKLGLLGMSFGLWAVSATQAKANESVEDFRSFMQNPVEYVRCESFDYRYNSCSVGFGVNRVVVDQQLSRAACQEGFSWGVDYQRGIVWVDRGCRAVFRIYREMPMRELECNSIDFRYSSCFVGRFNTATVAQQLSRTACIYGQTWGTTHDSIWVDRGCRARFRVQ